MRPKGATAEIRTLMSSVADSTAKWIANSQLPRTGLLARISSEYAVTRAKQ